MRSSALSTVLILITSFATSTLALHANSNSPCAAKCGNVLSETRGEDDITCYDQEYATTSKGSVFKECTTCQLGSKYVDPVTKQTDLQWAIYNLRYAVSWCVFGYPNNTNHASTPCMTRTACGALENSFEFDSLSPVTSAYSYCSLLHDNLIPACTNCIGNSDESFITNFVTALHAACQQQPIAGATITLDGILFSKTHVNITDPKSTEDNSVHRKEHGLPLGAKVGIAIGGLVVVLIIVGCCVVWHGKRRRRAQIARRQRESGYHEWVAQQVTQRSPPPTQMAFPPHARSPSLGYYDSPQSAFSQKPLFSSASWNKGAVQDDSSPGGEKVFSPYTSHYSSPVSATDQVQVVGREWPMDRAGTFGQALGQPTVRSRSREKRDNVDRIEMQNVAPVLLHPGNGRPGGANV